MLYDNPAARLKIILETGLKADKEQQCVKVWGDLLDTETTNFNDLFARLGKVLELPREITFLLKTHFPHQVDSSNLWLRPIEVAFTNQQLGGKWSSFIQHINPYCVPQLALVADLLHTKLSYQVAQDVEIEALTEKIHLLISDIEASSLPPHIRLYLIEELTILLHALREHKITGGNTPLKQAEAMIGHAHRDKEYLSFLRDHELGQRVLDNLNAVAAVLTVYLSTPQLAQSAFTLIGN